MPRPTAPNGTGTRPTARARRARRLGAVAATLALIAAAGATEAADPRGRYDDAKMTAKIRLNPVGTEHVAWTDGSVSVQRRKIKTTFIDAVNDRQIKMTMALDNPLENVTNQVVTVASGEVFVKDLQSGAVVASGGQFVEGRFRIRRRNDADRTWVIKHDQRLKITEISGIFTRISDATLKAKR